MVVQAEAQAEVQVEPQEVQLGRHVQGLEVQAEELQEHPHQVHHHHHPGKVQGQGVRYACRDHRLKGNYRSSDLGRVEKRVLIPDHITRYDGLLGFRVIEDPCLVIRWVANKGSLSGV